MARGTNGRASRGRFGGRCGNVFELEGDYRDLAGEAANSVQVFVGSRHFQIGNLACRRVFIRRKRMDAITHSSGRDGEHAPELTAAQNANGAAWKDRGKAHERESWRTASVWDLRHSSIFMRISGYLLPRMLPASSAALVAPAVPIARVPTGTPAGICTIESSESTPLSVLLLMGTPSTGRDVWAATMPGK